MQLLGDQFADAVARMSRSKDHRNTRPTDLHLARQINAVVTWALALIE
jgi:hypothetical protein